MKPIRLRMKAFGPYPGSEVVDFSEFQGHLFLIFGPTGSGKTTIFDAICYALYNKTSGDLRSGEEMCSDHVEEGVQTEVEFDFSVGRKLYRIRRSPAQLRAKLKGTGYREVPAEVEFYDQTGVDEDEDGALLGTGPKVVGTRVKEILGFEADQFRQVVLIPQGDFRKLLTAKSDEREKILKVLFSTAVYTKIQDKLKDRVRLLGKTSEEKRFQRSGLFKAEDCVSEEELTEKLAGLTASGEGFVQEKEKQTAVFQEAMVGYSKAEKIFNKFQELDDALEEKKTLDQDKKLVAGKRKELELGVKALALADVKSARDNGKKALGKARDASLKAGEENERAAGVLKTARAEQAKTDKKKPDLKKLGKELVGYENMKPKVEVLGGLRQALEGSQEKLVGLNSEYEDQEKELVEIEASIKKEQGELESGRKEAGRKDALDLELKAARQNLADREKLDGGQESLEAAEKKLEKAEVDLEKREKALLEVESNLDKVQKAWEESRVHVIAGTLEEGESCPVCGSTEHPHPASAPASGEPVGDEELRQARDAQSVASESLSDARGLKNDLSTEVKNLKKTIKDLGARQEVKKQTAEMIGEMIPTLEKGIESSKKAEKAADQLKNSLEVLEKKKGGARGGLEKLLGAVNTLKIKIGTDEATIKEKATGIPAELLDTENFENKYRDVEQEKESLEQSIKDNADAVRAAENTAANKKARHEERSKFLEKARSSRDEAQKTFMGRLKGEGFASENAYEEALREKAEISELEKEVNSHDTALDGNLNRLKRARAATKAIKRPDLDLARKKRDGAKEVYAAAVEALAEHENEVAGMKDVQTKVKRLTKALAREDKKMEVFSRLSDAANGGGSVGEKITFQRYVLAGILDDVTIAATERLRRMSVDRYELRRATKAKDKRSATGLDLEVFDDHTGDSRRVTTLSGGEMFLASLSLALGLSDVVQAYSGGIHLDSIFIDEGFGSLDSDTLDQAIDTLVALNKGGRMVGVISHVGELKERIDLGLEIKSTARGSTVVA